MSSYLVVDSGTTTTRVRLWQQGYVRQTETRTVGARDTAADGDNRKIREALRDMIQAMRKLAGPRIDAVICSGMITSDMGLLEVPHLRAPAGVEELARSLVRRELPDIADIPFYFVPGVKTLPDNLDVSTLAEADVLRGEEVECVGLHESLGLQGPATFVHFGSHHKAIMVDASGRILGSRTALTGEILTATRNHTILKSSTLPLEELEAIPRMWRAGLDIALRHGLGRALFLVRIGHQLTDCSKDDMTSFMLGVLASLDLSLLSHAGSPTTLVLYGTGVFPPLLHAYIREQGRQAILVDRDKAEAAAVSGAVRIFEVHRNLRTKGDRAAP